MTRAQHVRNPRELSWYCAEQDRVLGPFTWLELRDRVVLGKLVPDDFVCPQGQETWCRAIALEGLFPDETRIQSASPQPLKQGPARAETPQIPGYEILCELGRGGVGVVYKARQVTLNRLVALKVLHGAENASAVVQSRLTGEARALARLRHPGIVQIFDVSTHQGMMYLALELIEGGNLHDRIDGKPLPQHEAVAFLIQIARAMHFAHENGIIHRDLKPANVLLRTEAGGALPTIKVTDFGLAKDLARVSQLTTPGTVMGTPAYMAPEQAAARSVELSPRTDVYALGVILYELLCGAPPFVGPPHTVLFHVLERQPPSLREKVPQLAAEVEAICRRCMEKKPDDRFGSALEVAEKLEAWLGKQHPTATPSTVASPAPPARRSWLVAALVVGQLLTVLALGALAWMQRPVQADSAEEMQQLRIALDNERTERLGERRRIEETLQAERTRRLLRALHYARTGARPQALRELEGPRETVASWEAQFVQAVIATEPFELPPLPARITALASSADGRRVALGMRNGKIRLLRADSGVELTELTCGTGEITSLLLSAEGQSLFAANKDGTFTEFDLRSGTTTNPNILSGAGHADFLTGSAALPLAWGWFPPGKDATQFGVLDRKGFSARQLGTSFQGEVTALAISPVGVLRLAIGTTRTGSAGPEYRIVQRLRATGAGMRAIDQTFDDDQTRHTKAITTLAYSPDGKSIASGSQDRTVKVWDASTRVCRTTLTGHQAEVVRIAYAGEGTQLHSVDSNLVVKVWDVATGKEIRSAPRRSDVPITETFLNAELTHLFWVRDLTHCVVVPQREPALRTCHTEKNIVRWLVPFADENEIALATADQGFTILDPLTGKARKRFPDVVGAGEPRSISPDGKLFIAAGLGSRLRLWTIETEKSVDLPEAIKGITSFAWRSDSQQVAIGGPQTVWIVDPVTHALRQTLSALKGKVDWLAWLPGDEQLLVIEGTNAHLFDTREWQVKQTITLIAPGVSFALHGTTRLALGTATGTIALWDLATGQVVHTLQAHTGRVSALAFAPDGRRLLSGGEDGLVRWWDPQTGWGTFALDEGWPIVGIVWARDSKFLTVATGRWLRLYTIGQADWVGRPAAR